MPRGRKRGHHRGGFKNFTNMEDLAAEEEKRKKDQQWRRQRGLPSDDEGSDKEEEERGGAARGLPPSDDSETESSSDEDRESKPKGVSHLIDIQNPNHVKPKTKKVTALEVEGDEDGDKPQLTRKQREEIEKQQAHQRYMKKHLEGKTEEAQADMARLALIRKQREEAAKRREGEKKAKDDAKEAAEQRLLDRKKQSKK